MIFNKLIRFFKQEKRLQLSLLIIAVLLGLIALERQMLKKQEKRLQMMKAQKELVLKIGEMKKAIESQKAMPFARENKKMRDRMVLQGTVLKGKVYHALINGFIYKQGDAIGNYLIVEIHKNSIVLVDKLTKKFHLLKISEVFSKQPRK